MWDDFGFQVWLSGSFRVLECTEPGAQEGMWPRNLELAEKVHYPVVKCDSQNGEVEAHDS